MQRFHEARKLKPATEEMPAVLDFGIVKGIYEEMSNQVGPHDARRLLMEGLLWDVFFNRPEWHPEKFSLRNEREEKHYERIFHDLVPFICLYNRLKEEYGDERAQAITAQVTVPATVPYLMKTFQPVADLHDIGQFRQLLTNYMGDGEGFEWSAEVADDQSEVRYRFTRCVYIEVLRAYGLTSAAQATCYCDHIVFDNVMPNIYFRRDHCKGVGDSYCDHRFKIRTPDDAARDDERYGDTDKADFDARGMIRRWADNYRENGGRFAW